MAATVLDSRPSTARPCPAYRGGRTPAQIAGGESCLDKPRANDGTSQAWQSCRVVRMGENPAMPEFQRAFLDQLRADGAALLTAVHSAPLAPVSTCPGWDNMTLAAHVGGLWHWASRQTRQAVPVERPERPTAGGDELDEAAGGLAALLRVLEKTDPHATAWNWTRSEPQTAAFWLRRMTQETAMHRWDAQAAAGEPDPIVSWLAADGVEEVMTMWLPARRGRSKEAVTGTAHLHATDVTADHPSEWFLHLGPDGAVSYQHIHQKGDAVLRGTPSDILLRMWGRRSQVDQFGDDAVLAALRAE